MRARARAPSSAPPSSPIASWNSLSTARTPASVRPCGGVRVRARGRARRWACSRARSKARRHKSGPQEDFATSAAPMPAPKQGASLPGGARAWEMRCFHASRAPAGGRARDAPAGAGGAGCACARPGRPRTTGGPAPARTAAARTGRRPCVRAARSRHLPPPPPPPPPGPRPPGAPARRRAQAIPPAGTTSAGRAGGRAGRPGCPGQALRSACGRSRRRQS